jgi:hypothetical protein
MRESILVLGGEIPLETWKLGSKFGKFLLYTHPLEPVPTIAESAAKFSRNFLFEVVNFYSDESIFLRLSRKAAIEKHPVYLGEVFSRNSAAEIRVFESLNRIQ